MKSGARNGLTLHFFWVSCVANVDSNPGAANHCELLYNCLSIQEQFPCPPLEMICSTTVALVKARCMPTLGWFTRIS
ncbi:hypothetical protein JTE90_025779 [Oedothorax gibbosus]|uniref:Secreted protein n=1 Tax=Oedothorax gibbosus TaxID=931172 RepID=A0AAV6THU8_9ARAC|nr:hypothetical protein JTE90_025779 [Oedothorax gibbosus]